MTLPQLALRSEIAEGTERIRGRTAGERRNGPFAKRHELRGKAAAPAA